MVNTSTSPTVQVQGNRPVDSVDKFIEDREQRLDEEQERVTIARQRIEEQQYLHANGSYPSF